MADETDQNTQLIEAMTAMLPPLLVALDTLEDVARKLHPPQIEELVDHVAGVDMGIRDARPQFEAAPWPDHLTPVRDRILAAADHVLSAYGELAAARHAENFIMAAYKALRHASRATEALYPLAAILPPVNRFFLEPARRDDEAKLAALAEGANRDDTGVIEASNDKAQRGGFSLYVPEDYDETRAYPLVMALHGGSGHGRGFLWSWLREARSRGIVVISPTSRGDTWSLMGDDIDTPNLEAMLTHVRERWNVDASKLLLTGMSDGGTFAYVSALRDDSPFTHLAPMSTAFHPMLGEMASAERLDRLPVYVVHGALDWMFPSKMAEMAAETLTAKGADVKLDVIADLSHTYPREVNARVLDWFLA
jgi:phospholipase/carboxylesterase